MRSPRSGNKIIGLPATSSFLLVNTLWHNENQLSVINIEKALVYGRRNAMASNGKNPFQALFCYAESTTHKIYFLWESPEKNKEYYQFKIWVNLHNELPFPIASLELEHGERNNKSTINQSINFFNEKRKEDDLDIIVKKFEARRIVNKLVKDRSKESEDLKLSRENIRKRILQKFKSNVIPKNFYYYFRQNIFLIKQEIERRSPTSGITV